MQAIFQLIGHVAKWAVSNPRHMQTTAKVMYATQMTYRQLSPEAKQKVDALVIEGARMLAKLALGDAIDWLGGEATRRGLSSAATEVAKKGLRRASDVGVDKAIEEMRDS